MKDTGFGVPEGQRDRIAPRYMLDENLKLVLAPEQSPFPAVAGTPAGVTPKMLLSIAASTRRRRTTSRFAQMLANLGQLDGVRILTPSSVKPMTSNLLADGVQVHFTQPFFGVGYGMNLGIALDPARGEARRRSKFHSELRSEPSFRTRERIPTLLGIPEPVRGDDGVGLHVQPREATLRRRNQLLATPGSESEG
jgi:CubicO group peptidase (beta-lactamase class C family)